MSKVEKVISSFNGNYSAGSRVCYGCYPGVVTERRLTALRQTVGNRT
ncbi:hypothetical protein Dtox_2618 [Desulfofarcimen acetoxidans DSM 771]|uniref:Uncharacterized protein n=1 Tax=Desulfofarcimen acetoxidans (strain ATCC 49208 / DSM 771 / KCTC 5769 / VKM B-1644 / 5575) TaxID=485916 RepID=C8W114_DESAS|nr:hypothetical protein [Desulfofarcimen acetoxidans]ACV63410.1 hypothetical protein Dtox_2618 [Desulfofarcimen acetoxidans DSM 771]